MTTHRLPSVLAWLLAICLLAAVALVPVAPALAESEARLDVKFVGVINAVPMNPGEVWIIGGQTVAVNAATRIVVGSRPAEAGQWADVTARRQADASLLAIKIVVMPPEVRLRGPIGDKPDDPQGLGAWIIAGQTIWVTAETRLDTRRGMPEEGGWAEVVAIEEPLPAVAAEVNATRLVAVRLSACPPQPEIEVTGAIQAFSETAWTLSSIVLQLDSETLVAGLPAVDLIAHAAARLEDDGSLTALRLRVSWVEPGNMRSPVTFIGLIELLPPRGLVGPWVVDGKTVLVMPNTAVYQQKGWAVVGAKVEVKGWQVDNKTIATEITVLESPAGPIRLVRIAGKIEALPPTGLIGNWQISGQTVTVTERTRIEGARFAAVGAEVQGEGLALANGSVIANWLRISPKVEPQPSHTPMPTRTSQPSRTPMPTQTPQPSRTPRP